MKKLLLVAGALALAGCANFKSEQTDLSYEKGAPSRSITTKTSARTFFAAKSELSRYKALTTDKTQSLGIGGLNQEATNDVNRLAESIARGAVSGAVKPTP